LVRGSRGDEDSVTLPIDRIEGALVGTMTGDSLGFAVDGTDPGPLHHRFPTPESISASEPARYGVATEMTVATAESLAVHPEFDAADMAARLAGEASVMRGYGGATRAAIDRLRAGVAWSMAAEGTEGRASFGNGAAVRMAPIGCAFHDDLAELRWVAEEAAGITHSHALACEGAALQAIAVAVAASAGGKEISGESFLLAIGRETNVREYRKRYEIAAALVSRDTEWKRIVERLGNSRTALGSVVTAAYCFARSPSSFAEAVSYAVYLAGNTAALGAMTGAISGAHLGVAAIPARWRDKLERGPVSPERLHDLAHRLGKRGLAPGRGQSP
jgi:poly(ADP-ribose) glycohydrolase ARH3